MTSLPSTCAHLGWYRLIGPPERQALQRRLKQRGQRPQCCSAPRRQAAGLPARLRRCRPSAAAPGLLQLHQDMQGQHSVVSAGVTATQAADWHVLQLHCREAAAGGHMTTNEPHHEDAHSQ